MSPRRFAGLRARPLVQLTRARVLEFLREPEVIFWVFLFPVLLAVALGIAFREQPDQVLPVGVEIGPGSAERLQILGASPRLQPSALDRAAAHAGLRGGKLALVVLATEPPTYWFDPTRPDSRLARLEVDTTLQAAAGRADAFVPAETKMTERGSRYVDFLIPGLLAMNLMSTGMWAVGFSLVQQRAGKLLKLFVAAPIRRWHLLAAQVLARLVFLGLETAVLIVFAVTVLDVPLRGSLAAFLVVALLGAMCFVGLGILVAARPRTIEGVSGLMNFAMLPMWVCSGVFFSYERFPAAVLPLIRATPMTALVDALRRVMLDGAGLLAVSPELAVMAVWGLLSFVVALKIFRWQ